LRYELYSSDAMKERSSGLWRSPVTKPTVVAGRNWVMVPDFDVGAVGELEQATKAVAAAQVKERKNVFIASIKRRFALSRDAFL
jgi:hypothetical protein